VITIWRNTPGTWRTRGLIAEYRFTALANLSPSCESHVRKELTTNLKLLLDDALGDGD
jgi:hypothetical protein